MQGSKRSQSAVIQRFIPDDTELVVEPFCGSAAVSIGVMQGGLAKSALIADLNHDIVRLWRQIVEEPELLVTNYAEVWAGQFSVDGVAGGPRGYFNAVRDRFNDAGPNERSEADFLFLLNRIVKAALRYGKSGRMNQSADSRRAGAKPSTVAQRVLETQKIMRDATILHGDWQYTLAQATPRDVVYLDPPYQGTTNTRDQRYVSGLSVEMFEKGLRHAVDNGLSLIISYDALAGPRIYGRPLDPSLGLLGFDVVTGVSAQGTLLGRKLEAHETLYLSPALVARLGGIEAASQRVNATQDVLFAL